MKLHRRHIRGQVDVDSSPEGGRKAAPKHDVRRSFLRAIADLTSSVMQHVPLFQVFPDLNSVPDEEPGEELHSWGSPVVPNEGSEWACGVPRRVHQPIKRRGVQLAVKVGERARPPVWYLRRTPPSHDCGNLSRLLLCHNSQSCGEHRGQAGPVNGCHHLIGPPAMAE